MRIAYVEITRDCNLGCIFCSVAGTEKVVHGVRELEDFLRRQEERGFEKVLITGGEPLLSQELERLVRYALSLGFREVSIQTNGTLMSKEKARSLKEAGVDQVVFSIHSHLPLMVDRIMKGKGVLKKQLTGLVNAYEAGLVTCVTVVITRQNYRILPSFLGFMVENYPFVKHYTLNFVDPVGRSEGRKEIVPKYSELEPFLLSTLLLLENAGKSFRVERVPLCYMTEFAEYSTELRRIVTEEPNVVKRRGEGIIHVKNYFEREYVYGEACSQCWLKAVCPGVKDGYAELYGTDELYPVFIRPEAIISRAGED